MFRAVRKWWLGERGRRLVGLFAFEFSVVMLGVLAAQGLADWAEDRSAQRRLEASLERIRRDAGYNMAAAQARQLAAPCLAERMALIMRTASSGAPLAEQDRKRPALRFNYFDPLSAEDDLLLRKRGDDQLADSIQQFDSSVEVMSQRMREIADRWSAFELLEPSFGAVLPQDRALARQNASAIRANLLGIGVGARSIGSFGEALNARAIFDRGERVPRDCAEIWKRGQTMIVDGQG